MAGRRLRHSTRVCAEAEARIGAGPNATPPAAADRLDRGEPPDEETEGGTQPADKSLINRRLKLCPSAVQQLGVPAAASLPRAAPANCCPTLDRGHKRLAENKGGARCYLFLPELSGAHRRMERDLLVSRDGPRFLHAAGTLTSQARLFPLWAVMATSSSERRCRQPNTGSRLARPDALLSEPLWVRSRFLVYIRSVVSKPSVNQL
jgi:hypothetical protein